MYLLDSNIIIYSAKQERQGLFIKKNIVLGKRHTTPPGLVSCAAYPTGAARGYKYKAPPGLQKAFLFFMNKLWQERYNLSFKVWFALVNGRDLVTRNTADFEDIAGLNIINPFS